METLPVERLLKKIQLLEADHADLKQKMSNHHGTRPILPPASKTDKGSGGPWPVNLTNSQYLSILESLGQALHIIDPKGCICYWNKAAENLYGYSVEEALGQVSVQLVVDSRYYGEAYNIIHRNMLGQIWTGQFPVQHKSGRKFTIAITTGPFYDDADAFIGVILTQADSEPFKDTKVPIVVEERPLQVSSCRVSVTTRHDIDPPQPKRKGFSSKIANLASKVSNKVKSKILVEKRSMDSKCGDGDSYHPVHYSDYVLPDNKEGANSTGTSRVILQSNGFGVFFQADCRAPVNSSGDIYTDIHKVITSKKEAWIDQEEKSWPWKGNEQGGSEDGAKGFVLSWMHNDQVNDSIPEEIFFGSKPETQVKENNWPANNEASEIINSPSIGYTRYSALNMDFDTDYSDYEILWEDLIIGGQIGEGSCGTVYHGQWDGSDVAVKLFSKLEYSYDTLCSFKKEVSLMKRLRHPNVLLFMGAVTSPERLCIVTEFLPCGSLFQLLRRNPSKLDWRRRVNMAMDIAWGMNYLHHFNPPIIHRDLKSSNILVDKNWTLKVGDFGLSRLKHETFLLTKSGKGTPQWMAPEFLRCEPSDEKSDVYSYGVILWELATDKIPWDNLHPMQVIAAVGFMDQRLEIPKSVDPEWASMIHNCWHNNPADRPTFLELLEKLRALQRRYNLHLKAARSAISES